MTLTPGGKAGKALQRSSRTEKRQDVQVDRQTKLFHLVTDATDQGDQKIGKKWPKTWGKSSQNNCQTKKFKIIFIKAQLESSKHLHQPHSNLLRYLQ
jgi:hypothetical protein